MSRNLLLAISCFLHTGQVLAGPSIGVVDLGVDDLLGVPNLLIQVITDAPTETMTVELAMEWEAHIAGVEFPPLFSLVSAVAVEPFTSPASTLNPYAGEVTSGLWPEFESNRLYASFHLDKAIGAQTSDFLAAEYLTTNGGHLSLTGLITADGVGYPVEFNTRPIAPPPSFECFDFGRDGDVDISDFGIFADNYGGSGPTGDCDHDGDVDITDFGFFADSFLTQSSAVPEPGTALLTLAAIALSTGSWRCRLEYS